MTQYKRVSTAKLVDFLIKLIVKNLKFGYICLDSLLLLRGECLSFFNKFFFSVQKFDWDQLLKFAQNGKAMVKLIIEGACLDEEFTLSIDAEKRNKEIFTLNSIRLKVS